MFGELRRSLRTWAHRPAAASLGIASLALCIGLSTAGFSILWGSLWKPLPLPEPHELVRVESLGPDGPRQVAPAVALGWLETQTTLEYLVPWQGVWVVLSGDERPARQVPGAYVDPAFFAAAAVSPALGRPLQASDDLPGGPLAVVVGHELWTTRYGGDEGAVGRTVQVGGERAVLVGVMPPGFRFPSDQELWLPLGRLEPAMLQRTQAGLDVFGRLRDGVGPEPVEQELGRLAKGLAPADAEPVSVRPFVAAQTRAQRRPLMLMAGSILGVLLIGCSNVAILLLARWAVRRRELTVRWALGAGRWRLVRHVFVDALAVSLCGGLLGLVLAREMLAAYNSAGGLVEGFWVDVRLSPEALSAVVGAVLVTTVLSGLLPAWLESVRRDRSYARGLSGHGAGGVGGGIGRRGARFGEWLVAGQVALSCGLLAATLLTVRSVEQLESEDFGEAPERVWVSQVMLDSELYPDWSRWLGFYDEFAEELRGLPGVTEVAFASRLPTDRSRRMEFRIAGRQPISGAEAAPQARWSLVSAGFFDALERPLLEGRNFTSSDVIGRQPVVIVNRRWAETHSPGKSPVGQRLKLQNFGDLEFTVVGVAADLYLGWDFFSSEITREVREGLYLPLTQHPPGGAYVVLRSETPAASLTEPVRRTLSEFSPHMALFSPGTLAARVDGVTARYRLVRNAFSVFGLCATVLGASGLFALVSFVGAQRRRELAIHMALGATRRQLAVVAVGGLGVLVAVGLAVGAGLGAWLSRLLEAFLYGLEGLDAVTLAAVVGLLVFVVGAAVYLPLRRSTTLEPAEVLRQE